MVRIKLTIVLLFFCLVSFGQLKNAVVGYWKFEETSGTNARDERGINDGTNTNIILDATGRVGKCYDFEDSSDPIVDIPDNSTLSFTDGSSDLPCSFACWINVESFSATGNWIINKRDFVSNNEYQFILLNKKLSLYLFNISDGANIARSATVDLTTGTWIHIVGTYDGSESVSGITLYKDGSEFTSTDISSGSYTGMVNSTATVSIGSRKVAASLDFDGLIDEVMIYKTEINQNFISQLYAGGNGRLYVWENFMNGKITYSEWLEYDLFCTYINLKYAV